MKAPINTTPWPSVALKAAAAAVALVAAACSTAGTTPTPGAAISPSPGATAGVTAGTAPAPSIAPVSAGVHGIVVARPCTGGPESVIDTPCPGIPIPGAQVVFTPSSGPSSTATTATTAADGTFSVGLAPGRYGVTVAGRHYFAGSLALTLEVPVPASALDSAGLLRLVVDSGLR